MTRTFHNITAHYNIFFNARESYKKGLSKGQRQYKDDFTSILKIFPEDDPSNASAMGSDMDRVIQKVSKLISNHSIKAKPEQKRQEQSQREADFYNKPEYNRWVDDGYLLMGMAHFRKNELESALQTFSYVNKTYTDPEIITKAAIWRIKTLDAMNRFADATKSIEALKDQIQQMPASIHSLYYAVSANHYLLQQKYEQAFSLLKQAYQYTHKKKEKYRYAFILGQLARENNDHQQAVYYFKKVLAHKPEYTFAFNARVLLAESSGRSGENVREVEKDLKKLLRDKKNKEFKDQIYYAYGKLSQNENKIDEAIGYFKKSAISSVNNNRQKAESYLEIAHISFDRNDYIQAQQYYDSAIHVLPQNYPDYEQIKTKSNRLNALALYLNEIELQDSLQMLADMSNTERLAVIDNIIEKVREKEREEKEAQTIPNYSPGMEIQNQVRFQDELQRGGKWYFYNPSAMGFGRNEFKRKWGDRVLEDNWRRKNKTSVNFEVATSQQGGDTLTVSQTVMPGDLKSRSYYLKQIPLTDSMRAVSDKKIMEGLFESALIYHEDFNDLERAEHNLLSLIDRYPGTDNTFLLPAYFTLYQMYKEAGNNAAQQTYKNLVIGRFPNSEQAKILGDPLYLKKLYDQEKETENEYEQVYRLFTEGLVDQVIARCRHNLQTELPPSLASKYLFLQAQAIGEKGDLRAYKQALNEVTEKASDQKIVEKANEIISQMNTAHPVLKKEELTATATEIYHYSPDVNHQFVIMFPTKEIDVNRLKFDLLNFNTDFAPQQDLPVTEHDIFADTTLLSVENLGDITQAMQYYNRLRADTSMVNYLKNNHVNAFLFSSENFATFAKNKSIEAYRIFFEKYYLTPRNPHP